MRLKNKLLLLLIPIIILPLSGLSFIAVKQLNTLTQANTTREFDHVLAQYQTEFDTLINTAVANIKLFSQSMQLEHYLLTSDEGERYRLLQPSLMRLFSSYQQAFPDYYDIRIILPDGYEDTKVTNSYNLYNGTEKQQNLDLSHIIQHMNSDPVSIHFQTNSDDNHLIIHIARKISLVDRGSDPLIAKKKLRAYMIFSVSLESFFSRLSTQRIGDKGYLFVMDKQGVVKFHPDPAHVGEHLPMYQEIWTKTDAIKTSIFNSPVYLRGFKQRGQLMIIGVLPLSELNAASDKLTFAVIVISSLSVLLIMVIILWLFKHFFLNPVDSLRSQIRDFAQGELLEYPDHFNQDELGELTYEFSEMAQELDKSHHQIQFQAHHDHLTGLVNRLNLRKVLNDLLDEQSRPPFSLLLIDIDGFKNINDTMGHRAGDDLLKLIAQRMIKSGTRIFNKSDITFARLGGDEFLVVLHEYQNKDAANDVAQAILDGFKAPFEVLQQNIYVGASIGISHYPEHGSNAEELMHNADLAMFSSKNSGKNQITLYHDGINDIARERAELEVMLHEAMQSSTELYMSYQPKVHALSGKTHSVESLIRWKHPQKGFIGPDIFIPVAEDTGQIVKLGEWIIRTVCRQAVMWNNNSDQKLKMAINVSPKQLVQKDFLKMVISTLEQEKCLPHMIEFELTETSILTHDEHLIHVLQKFNNLGITISLDDFGTGYSSLSHLRRYSINTIKIDRSFIQESTENIDDQSIVKAIINMAHNLDMDVVAEGVETEEQFHFLKQQGCDYIQGYYFSRPVSAQELKVFINTRV